MSEKTAIYMLTASTLALTKNEIPIALTLFVQWVYFVLIYQKLIVDAQSSIVRFPFRQYHRMPTQK